MYDDVLVYLADAQQWSTAAMFGIELAAGAGSRLRGMHAYSHGNRPEPDLVAEGVIGRFADVARSRGVMAARTDLVQADVGTAIANFAAWSDVVVLDSATDSALLREIVFTCGRPCLAVPARAPVSASDPRRIVLGWNGSIEAMRAMHAALPLLRRADQVFLLDGGNDAVADRCDPAPDPLAYLASHNVAVTQVPSEGLHRLRGERIMEIAREQAADLLVLGAYRHRRYSEWDLGEVIAYVLAHSDMPVLLQH